MRDNISIIFATIILTFLIIILPLYSILDRQDNMAYNVVLSETTKIVDEVRSNGFLTQETYSNYLRTLTATGNTYKVVIEAYRKTLIPDGENTYKEVRELYNTQDIEEIITGTVADSEKKESNKRENIFLLDVNDEFYIHVYNTNMTAGTVLYNSLLTSINTKVIDVKYGGVVNNVNWELYTKLKKETVVHPTVTLSIPGNAEGSINIEQLITEEELSRKECATLTNLTDIFKGAYQLCTDVIQEEAYKYIYYLDKTNDAGEYINKTINIVAKLNNVDMLDVSTNLYSTDYQEITKELLSDSDVREAIAKKYVRLNGMNAKIEISELKELNNNYYFNITLKDVERETDANISQIASVSILSGLGKDKQHLLTLEAETVKIELTAKDVEKEITLVGPYNWKQFKNTNDTRISKLSTFVGVYINQEIFYKIQYNKVNDMTPQEVVEELKKNIAFTLISSGSSKDDNISGLEFFSEQDMQRMGLTIESNTIVVKWAYTSGGTIHSRHRMTVSKGWISGAKALDTGDINVGIDDEAPNEPVVDFEGTVGKNNWYTSDVAIKAPVLYSYVPLGSGIYRNIVSVVGETNIPETDAKANIVLNTNGKHWVHVYAEDCVGNKSDGIEYEVNIDKEKPTEPVIDIKGTLGSEGWYTSELQVNITGGVDLVSGVERTTYKVEEQTGKYSIQETSMGTNRNVSLNLNNSGQYRIEVTTYDKAGNTSTTTRVLKIDLGRPANSSIEILGGLKHTEENDWYYTDVRLRIHIIRTLALTHSNRSQYILRQNGIEIESGWFEGLTKDLLISQGTGNYELQVNTYTVSRPDTYPKIATYTIKIDKEGPEIPKVLIAGVEGTNGWYQTNVNLKLNETNDTNEYRYVLTNNITNEKTEQQIEKDASINMNIDGRYTVQIFAKDIAGNETYYEKDINIDKTAPTGTMFINGSSGFEGRHIHQDEDGTKYYNTEVAIECKYAQDDTSGINEDRIQIEPQIIVDEQKTEAKVVIYDNAGNALELKQKIVVDMTKPQLKTEYGFDKNNIIISGIESDTKIQGVTAYNSAVQVEMLALKDDNFYEATYVVKGPNMEETGTIEENGSKTLDINGENGFYYILVTTVDKAGNKTNKSRTIYISRDKVNPIREMVLNGEFFGDEQSSTKGGSMLTVTLTPDVIGFVTLTVKDLNGNVVQEMGADTNGDGNKITMGIELMDKGEYEITATQTSISEITSEVVQRIYYTYE